MLHTCDLPVPNACFTRVLHTCDLPVPNACFTRGASVTAEDLEKYLLNLELVDDGANGNSGRGALSKAARMSQALDAPMEVVSRDAVSYCQLLSVTSSECLEML